MPPIISGPSGLVPGADPRATIEIHGPRIGILLSVPQAQANAIQAAGGAVPQPVAGLALLDTGANNTAIDDGVAQSLGLRAISSVQVNTPSGAAVQAQYLVETNLGAGQGLWRMTGSILAPQGLVALIGTDILSSCVFVYDGVNGSFTLSF